MTLLHPGDTFPTIDLHPVRGETIQIPEALRGKFGVVLFHRGAWCQFCNAQLRAFERVRGELDQLGAAVVSLSVDDEATTKELVDKHKLTFPVGHSADARKVSKLTGAFGPGVPAGHRLRPGPRGQGHRQRVLLRSHRPPHRRRHGRDDPLRQEIPRLTLPPQLVPGGAGAETLDAVRWTPWTHP